MRLFQRRFGHSSRKPLRWPFILLTMVGLFIACRTADVAPTILPDDPLTASQASLVSVQALDGVSAEVIVKSIRLKTSDWQLTARGDGGSPVTLTTGKALNLPDFTLTTLRLTGLTPGKPYELRLAFRFADQDTVTALRTYTHQLNAGPRWTRLAHASFSGGDYSSFPVAVDGICGPNSERNGCGHPGIGAYVGNKVQLLRYPGPNQREMQTLLYDRATDSWPFYPVMYPLIPRHAMFQYNLFFRGVDRHQFTGLGFIAEERAPSKYYYYRTMSVILPFGGSPLVPSYEGENGELAFFTTTDEAYFLTQNGTTAMRSIQDVFTQTVRAPLPEPPGALATFSIRNIGYVVNQRPGQPVRLWAYDPATDAWSQKADFPGAARGRGVAFSMARNGYFGLGLTPDGQGLRDIWQYNPGTNQWRRIGDYPGQGNQLLAVFSAPDGIKPERAYLGWGYEAQRISTGVNRIVGCTDFWELTP